MDRQKRERSSKGAERSDPAPDSGTVSSFARFNAFNQRLKARHGARVFRVEMPVPAAGRADGEWDARAISPHPPRAFPADAVPPATIRDRLVQNMVRLNERYGATRFHLHLNTMQGTAFGPPLRSAIREALTLGPVVGLILKISPDAVNDEVLESLETAVSDREVWLELKVQAPAPSGAGRGPKEKYRETFSAAVRTAKKHSLPVIGTLCLGLPEEKETDWFAHAEQLNALRIGSVKIHPFHVERGTPPERSFRENEIDVLGLDEYVSILSRVVERLDASILLQGFGADGPLDRIAAPEWVREAADLHERLERDLESRHTHQGRLAR